MAELFRKPNKVDDCIFVRDETFEWLPGTIQAMQDERALVRIQLPKTWDTSTFGSCRVTELERWVDLKLYFSHRLPMQNDRLCRDMAELTYLHEASMLYQIKERHALSLPYTRVGEIVVAVNPCRWIPGLYSSERQQFYVESFVKPPADHDEKKEDFDPYEEASSVSFGSRDYAYDRLGCEPHVYEVSALAYSGLLNSGLNQTVLVSGESGAGKTETIKLVLRHLVTMDKSRTHDDLIQHLLESSTIFEAFGNARTIRNHNSSRFGNVTRLHYAKVNGTMSLLGCLFESYMLETSRVVSHASYERNFHIFYQMLSAPREIKRELLGRDWVEATAGDFRYLVSGSLPSPAASSDLTQWRQTCQALQLFGLEGSSLQRLARALGIILLLGNLQFDQNETEGEAAVSNRADLNILALSMGIPVEELEAVLINRMIRTVDDQIWVPNTVEKAKESCDALAKTIYAGIFSTVVRQINVLTSAAPAVTGKHNCISLVDLFGFESFKVNRFEQLCINYANERLQYKYVVDNLRRYKLEYELEGIDLPDWKDIDNSSTVEFFEGRDGLLRTLEEQCIRPNGTSEVFVFKLKQQHKTHRSLVNDKLLSQTEFRLRHFAGCVTYDASEFVERNMDRLPEQLISVASKSTNGIIALELSELLKTFTHQDSVSSAKRKASQRIAMKKFSRQLRELLRATKNSQTRYIRCIKPSEATETSAKFDHQTVLRQLRCSGLVIAIELSRKMFPTKLPFTTVDQRFSCLLKSDMLYCIQDMELHDKAQLMMSLLFGPYIEQYRGSEFAMPFACGHTKVFFRTGALEYLEICREKRFVEAAVIIQRPLRRVVKQRQFHRAKLGTIRLQSVVRGLAHAREFRGKRAAATKIQAIARCAIQRTRILELDCCTIVLQRWFKTILAKNHLKRSRLSCDTLSSWWLMVLDRQRFLRFRSGVSRIQASFKRNVQRDYYKEQRNSAVTISHFWRAVLDRLVFLRKKHAATVMASCGRTIVARARFVRMKHAMMVLQACLRSRRLALGFEGRRTAALFIVRWARFVSDRRRFLRASMLAKILTTWGKGRVYRTKFLRYRHSASTLAAYIRGINERQRFLELKAAANLVWSRRMSRKAGSRQHPWDRMKSGYSTPLTASPSSHGSHNFPQDDDSSAIVSRATLDELEYYKNKAEDLERSLMHVTADTAFHAQRVESEFEDRLMEYEQEVLTLKQTIQEYEAEKVNLKDEIKANVDNVRNLKNGIRSMQNSHRHYLNKVMRAIEKANVEHATSLEALKQDRDQKIEKLQSEVQRLSNKHCAITSCDSRGSSDDIYTLARKLEKLTSPDILAKLTASTVDLSERERMEFIEAKVSAKARKIIYRIEDNIPNVQGLQQQLVNAYEEIERLQNETKRGRQRYSTSPRRALRRMFER